MAVAILTKMLKQNAVYWAVSVNSQNDMIGATPVDVKCRWVQESEEIVDAPGRTVISNAKVNVASLDGGVREGADMKQGDYLLLGTVDGLDSKDLRDNLDVANKIGKYTKLPTLRADEFLRTAILI